MLVTGVGKGTKNLNDFLGCTKTYETVVLFGAETDTYDRLGKIVRRAPYEHITREAVEKALEQFRGKILQRPPIFSALKVQGKKLYEYAREGKEPPIEIQSRPVEVSDLRILEWYEPGTHEYKWPEVEAAGEEKEVAERLLAKEDTLPVAPPAETEVPAETSEELETSTATKRKTPPPAEEPTKDDADASDAIDAALAAIDASLAPSAAKKQKITAEGHSAPAQAEPSSGSDATEITTKPAVEPSSQPPAVKITMTVSSGFYVRSLAHDLGKALGSCGLMSSLIRTRQADFELDSDKVLEYKDLEAGEEVWGPKVKRFLEEWEKKRAEANME